MFDFVVSLTDAGIEWLSQKRERRIADIYQQLSKVSCEGICVKGIGMGKYDINNLSFSDLKELNREFRNLKEQGHDTPLIDMLYELTSDAIWANHGKEQEARS